jgi:hypothetical protein
MSSTDIQIVFDGPAVQAGTIKADFLADSLKGYSEVFSRANEIANGKTSEAVVLVRSDFKRGSFGVDVQLVQEITALAKQLAIAHPYTAAALAGFIGLISTKNELVTESLIDLYKWLKGKKPDKVVPAGNSNIEITLGQNKKTVNNFVVNMYLDPRVRAGFDQITSPLRQEGIDRLAVKHEGVEQVVIDKDDAPYFKTDPFQLEPDNMPMQGERDATLVVSKLSFGERSTWTFFERGAFVVAKIADKQFWTNVHQHKITFGEGDMLQVHLEWKIEKKTRLSQKNTITKVYKVIERPKQMRLDNV